MFEMHKFLLLCLVAYCQSSIVSDKQHFLSPIISKVNSAGSTWMAGHNFHPSVSEATLKRLCGSTFDETSYSGPYLKEDSYKNDAINIPKSFDARDQWPKCHYIGHVYDQGNCGSCWAVAIASTLTDRLCIATHGKFKYMLSSYDLLTCCNECGHGCNGGSPSDTWDHITRHGIVSGGDYSSSHGCKPYSIQPCDHHVDGTLPKCADLPDVETPDCHYRCSNQEFGHGYWRDTHKLNNYYLLNASVELVQQDIMMNGPVQAQFDVYEDFLTYKSGVYQHLTGKRIGSHAVKVIGWGEENGTPYWLVVNSWNKHWGEQGFFKIRRGINECKFDNTMFAGIPDLCHKYEAYGHEEV